MVRSQEVQVRGAGEKACSQERARSGRGTGGRVHPAKTDGKEAVSPEHAGTAESWGDAEGGSNRECTK